MLCHLDTYVYIHIYIYIYAIQITDQHTCYCMNNHVHRALLKDRKKRETEREKLCVYIIIMNTFKNNNKVLITVEC